MCYYIQARAYHYFNIVQSASFENFEVDTFKNTIYVRSGDVRLPAFFNTVQKFST